MPKAIFNPERLPGEEFRDIPNAPGYRVSNMGRIVSMRTAQGERLMRPGHDPAGYACVVLAKRCYKVHSIVAAVFIGPRPSGMDVNHKDLNKANNAADNLEYVSHADNIAHARRLLGNWSVSRRGIGRSIVRYDPITGERMRFPTILEAARSIVAAIIANGGTSKRAVNISANIHPAIDTQRVRYGYRWLSA